MAVQAKRKVTEARWRALLAYRARRYVEQKLRLPAEERWSVQTRLVTEIGVRGIEALGGDYRHVLSDHIYAERGQ